MFDAHVDLVLDRIKPGDQVLDVGGWARCFNRATHVIDFNPYATRGRHYIEHLNLGPQGGEVEHFSAETWVEWELCNHKPWPFADKQFDFCTCSHTLEDIRDPLWVCAEMNRVAKAGYIEVPSRLFESSRGREPGVPVGLSHHRWFVEVEGAHITFHHKTPHVHGDPRCSVPMTVWRQLPEREFITWMFWEDGFTFNEGWLGIPHLVEFAARYVPEHAWDAPDPAADAEIARLGVELAMSQNHVRALNLQIDELRGRLEAIEGLGPRSIALAKRVHEFAKVIRRKAS